jgi:putative peptidoglycan lipid II flippase
MRIAGAVLTMSVGLVAAMSVIPQAGVLSLTSLCLGGLVLYALAAWATSAVTWDDWAALRKKS